MRKIWKDLGVRRKCYGKLQTLIRVDKNPQRGQYCVDEEKNLYEFHPKDAGRRAYFIVEFICPDDGLVTQKSIR